MPVSIELTTAMRHTLCIYVSGRCGIGLNPGARYSIELIEARPPMTRPADEYRPGPLQVFEKMAS